VLAVVLERARPVFLRARAIISAHHSLTHAGIAGAVLNRVPVVAWRHCAGHHSLDGRLRAERQARTRRPGRVDDQPASRLGCSTLRAGATAVVAERPRPFTPRLPRTRRGTYVPIWASARGKLRIPRPRLGPAGSARARRLQRLTEQIVWPSWHRRSATRRVQLVFRAFRAHTPRLCRFLTVSHAITASFRLYEVLAPLRQGVRLPCFRPTHRLSVRW
jgi:hypothetical protein